MYIVKKHKDTAMMAGNPIKQDKYLSCLIS